MSDQTAIEWTDATWNPTRGCTKVSAGCDNCYAERVDNRWNGPGAFDTVRLQEHLLDKPLSWKKPRRIFVNSMSDLFHKDIPDEYIAQVFAVMAMSPHHTFQILTKRHARMRSLLSSADFWLVVGQEGRKVALKRAKGKYPSAGPMQLDEGSSAAGYWMPINPLPNVHVGVSVENQQWADIRIPALLDTPAAVRWISAEPLLGPVDLDQPRCDTHDRREVVTDSDGREWCGYCSADGFTGELSFGHWLDSLNGGIGWVVAGGESGRGARPMHPDWARSLRDQCMASGVPFLFKQWGEWGPAPFIIRVSDPVVAQWIGPDAVLAAAKQVSEAAGATHVHTGNWHMEDGQRIYGVHEIGHKPWSLERVGLPEGMEPIRRWGKKLSGRELDCRTWDQFPEMVAAGPMLQLADSGDMRLVDGPNGGA